MNSKQLNESLVELREELKRVNKVSARSREALKKLDDSIHRVLTASGEVPPEHHAGLRENLETSLEYLEAEHPTVTILVRRVLKALTDMGI